LREEISDSKLSRDKGKSWQEQRGLQERKTNERKNTKHQRGIRRTHNIDHTEGVRRGKEIIHLTVSYSTLSRERKNIRKKDPSREYSEGARNGKT